MKNKGFTLIELLVVISIIALLSSVVLASLNSARAKARDTERLQEIRSIRTALEIYYNDRGYYPTNATGNAIWATENDWTTNVQNHLVANKYLPSVPLDPINQWPGPGNAAEAYKYYRYKGRPLNQPAGIECGGVDIVNYEYTLFFTLTDGSKATLITSPANYYARNCFAGPLRNN